MKARGRRSCDARSDSLIDGTGRRGASHLLAARRTRSTISCATVRSVEVVSTAILSVASADRNLDAPEDERTVRHLGHLVSHRGSARHVAIHQALQRSLRQAHHFSEDEACSTQLRAQSARGWGNFASGEDILSMVERSDVTSSGTTL